MSRTQHKRMALCLSNADTRWRERGTDWSNSNKGKAEQAQCIQGNFAFIKHLVQQSPFNENCLAKRLNSVTLHIGLSTSTTRRCARCASDKNTEPRCENATRKKGHVEKLPRTASCASAGPQRGNDFPVAPKGRSVKDAVPGREDGKDAVTKVARMLPQKRTGREE